MSLQKKKNDLQETFLTQLQKSKAPVTLFLVNGIKLQGIITDFDNFSVLNFSRLVNVLPLVI